MRLLLAGIVPIERGDGHDPLPGLEAAGERDQVDPGVLAQRRPGVRAVAQQLQLPLGSVHRILLDLEEEAIVERTPANEWELSFGLLALSGTPALAQFGKMLVAGIGVAVLLAPLSLSLGARSPARG